MDVIVPAIPGTYDGFRATLRAFIAEHKPTLAWKQRTGLRVPDRAADVELLRTYVRAIHDAGYVLDRFSAEPGDPTSSASSSRSSVRRASPRPWQPAGGRRPQALGTDEQRSTYLPPMARGDHIWTPALQRARRRERPDVAADEGRPGRGRLRRGGPEGVEHLGPVVRLRVPAGATEPVEGPAGISAFILDMRSPGVDVRPLREMTGTTDFNEVFFDEVRVPAVNMIGAPGEGWRVAGASLAEERSNVGGAGGPTRCSVSSAWRGATTVVGARPWRTGRCASRSEASRPDRGFSATWASAWPPRR